MTKARIFPGVVLLFAAACSAAAGVDHESSPGRSRARDAGADAPVMVEPEPSSPLEWPNAESKANSDAWLVEHHDAITKMRPRVLAINLDNDPATRARFAPHVTALIAALAEGSRYHGYADGSGGAVAPPFLEYEVVKWVDLADDVPPAGWTHKYGSRVPISCAADDTFYNIDYSKLLGPELAEAYGMGAPLCELIGEGQVHEVWIHMNGDHDPYVCPGGREVQPTFAEILESKPIRDRDNAPIAGSFERCAGNGCLGDRDFAAFQACGRTVRVLYINSTRGPGCALHSAGHGYEWMARSGAVPELAPRFEAFANLDLHEKHGTPFRDWYACDGPGCLTFDSPNSVAWKLQGRTGSIARYDQGCGNVHFAPNATAHYDENDSEVLSSCEHYGLKDGPGGRDAQEPFSRAKYARYEALAPDCGGAWQVYWRQSFPGLGNQATDATGKPMRNWWPYLFY
ncbi:MAG: hypothetical protein KF894_11325 [Labilithrix sp.]|nr:hypothetical protein [Labilithrix sp.]